MSNPLRLFIRGSKEAKALQFQEIRTHYLTSQLNLSRKLSLMAQWVKNTPPKAGDPDLIPGSGRSPGEANGNPRQYPCLEHLMDGEAGGLQSMGRKESDTT